MATTRGQQQLSWKLTSADKDALRLCLLDYMVNQEYTAADVVVDEHLAFALMPYLVGFNAKWELVETLADLESAKFLKELLSILSSQFRNGGKALDKRVAERKQDRSAEARSKGPRQKSQSSIKDPSPDEPKSLKKQVSPTVKKHKLQIQDERTVSE